jgi:hypothetical protein
MATKKLPKWADVEFSGMSFEEVFGGVKREKKKKGVHEDEPFDIGV